MIVGSGAGGIDVAERQYGEFYSGAFHRVSPYAIPVSIVGIVSSEISIALGLRGVSHVLSTGCTSSTDAIGYAAVAHPARGGRGRRHRRRRRLRDARHDLRLRPHARASTTRYNDRPAEASRPFDRDRDGFVLGEGAWLMTLERGERARARGARDLRHGRRLWIDVRCVPSRADGSGRRARSCARWSSRSSGRAAPREAIGYVNYHGTSTLLNDAVEARCVRRVFGARADRVAGSSTKSMIGHPARRERCGRRRRDGAGARRPGMLPPTINLHDQDPDCDLDVIPNDARARRRGGGALQLPGLRIEEQRAGARDGHRPRTRSLHTGLMLDVLIIAGAGPAGSIAAFVAGAGRRARADRRSRDRSRATSCAATR